ncbi:MAG: DUF721 domain-containing protein [Rickettsiales bacterium]|jgi:hypothetical protein|nr:DUF721 domain-containing protein [Rickettsiales bacterium]
MSDEYSEYIIERPVAPKAERNPYGPAPIGNALADTVKKFAPKNGFVGADILLRWNEICGPEIAAMASPVKLSRAAHTLYIRLATAAFASVIEYRFPAIIDRINAFFGYKAVERIKISVA